MSIEELGRTRVLKKRYENNSDDVLGVLQLTGEVKVENRLPARHSALTYLGTAIL